MLRKIIGSIIALALAGFGIALMTGMLDPEELDSSSGGRRGRFFKRIVGWLSETLGPIGAGAVVLLVGAAILYFTLRPSKEEDAAPE